MSKAPPVAPPPVAPPKEPQGWDKDPVDFELDALAQSLDLQFEEPAAHEDKPDIELHRPDDDKKK